MSVTRRSLSRRASRGTVAMTALSTATLFLSVPPAHAAPAANPLGFSALSLANAEPIPTDTLLRDQAIEADISFRNLLSLRSDEIYVRNLYDHPELTIGTRNMALFTPDEFAEVKVRLDLSRDADTVRHFVNNDPALKVAFAGLYIDNSHAVGRLVVKFTPQAPADPIGAVMKRLLHPDRLTTQSATLSLTALESIQTAVDVASDSGSFGVPIGTAWVDINTNSVQVGLPQGYDQARVAKSIAVLTPAVATAPFTSGQAAAHISTFLHDKLPDVAACGTQYKNDCKTPSYDANGRYFGGHMFVALNGNANSTLKEQCTLGVPVGRAEDPNAGYALTAGHCINPGQLGTKIQFNYVNPTDTGVWMGVTKAMVINAEADLGVVKLINHGSMVSQPLASVGNHTHSSWLTGGYYPDLANGTPVCSAWGLSSVSQCGTVVNHDGTDGSAIHLMYVDYGAQAGCQGGDSGSPLFAFYGGYADWAGVARTGNQASHQCTYTRLQFISDLAPLGYTLTPRYDNGNGG